MADICNGCQHFEKVVVETEIFGKPVQSKTYADVDIPVVGIKCKAKCGNPVTQIQELVRAEYSTAILDTPAVINYQSLAGYLFVFEDDACPNFKALT